MRPIVTLHPWRTSRQRPAGWLALLAILLLYLAPAISKSLAGAPAPAHHAMMMDGAIIMMDDAMHGRAVSDVPLAEQHTAHRAMFDDSACGYCMLLAHLPMIADSLPRPWLQSLQARDGPPRLVSPAPLSRPFSPYRSRAPPRSPLPC